MTSHPTSAALHSAAVLLLEQHGEDAVTVEIVLARAGASKGSLYHHYRDFGSLIDRAQATRFATAVEGTVTALAAAPRGTRDDVVLALVRFAACALSPDDDAVRVSVLAAATHRPALRALLEPEQRRLTDAIAALVRRGQAASWVRRDLDAEHLALLLEAIAAGHVVGAVAGSTRADWQAGLAAVLRTGISSDLDATLPEPRRGNVSAPRT